MDKSPLQLATEKTRGLIQENKLTYGAMTLSSLRNYLTGLSMFFSEKNAERQDVKEQIARRVTEEKEEQNKAEETRNNLQKTKMIEKDNMRERFKQLPKFKLSIDPNYKPSQYDLEARKQLFTTLNAQKGFLGVSPNPNLHKGPFNFAAKTTTFLHRGPTQK